MIKKIKINIFLKDLYYNGEVIIRYVIKYPEILTSPFEKGKYEFNHYNRQQALKLKEYIEEELYNFAKKTAKENLYEIIRETNIIYNHKKIIKLHNIEEIYNLEQLETQVKSLQIWNLDTIQQKNFIL